MSMVIDMDEKVTLQDKLQAAIEAEAKGIPVSWKELCVETYNVAMLEVQKLQAEAKQPCPVCKFEETD